MNAERPAMNTWFAMPSARARVCPVIGLVVWFLLPGAFPARMNAADAPRVSNITPANGDKSVNPNLKELRIEFDQPMNTGAGFSIVGGGETFPKIVGQPRWVGDRVIVTPIELKPNQGYGLSVNSSRFQNFKGQNGKPAVPYPVKFKTASSGDPIEPKPLSVDDNRRSVNQLKEAMNQRYSHRDLRGVDWDGRFKEFESRLNGAKTRAAFARICAELLAPARDSHIWITADGDTIGTHQRDIVPNLDFGWLQRNVPKWKQHNRTVFSGEYPGGVAYLLIGDWQQASARRLEAAHAVIDGLKATDKLIIDARGNSGGDERLARDLAGRFVSAPVVYAKKTESCPVPAGRIFKGIRAHIGAEQGAQKIPGEDCCSDWPGEHEQLRGVSADDASGAGLHVDWRQVPRKFRQSQTCGACQWRHGFPAELGGNGRQRNDDRRQGNRPPHHGPMGECWKQRSCDRTGLEAPEGRLNQRHGNNERETYEQRESHRGSHRARHHGCRGGRAVALVEKHIQEAP